MKTSIIFFLLAISASAVCGNTINDVEDASKQFVALFVEILTTFLTVIEIEDEDINEAINNTRAGFLDTVSAVSSGTYDEDAINKTNNDFDVAITGIAKHMAYDGDDLDAALKMEADSYRDVFYNILHGNTSQLHDAIVKETSAFEEIMMILSRSSLILGAPVDVTVQVRDAKDALSRVYIGLHKIRGNNDLYQGSE